MKNTHWKISLADAAAFLQLLSTFLQDMRCVMSDFFDQDSTEKIWRMARGLALGRSYQLGKRRVYVYWCLSENQNQLNELIRMMKVRILPPQTIPGFLRRYENEELMGASILSLGLWTKNKKGWWQTSKGPDGEIRTTKDTGRKVCYLLVEDAE